MRLHHNWPLEKFTQFLLTRFSISCIVMYSAIKTLCSINLCNQHLTCIIHINKTRIKNVTLQCRVYDILISHIGCFTSLMSYITLVMPPPPPPPPPR